MAFLQWTEGPRERGCVYHQRAVHRLSQDNIVVDLFVMPSLRDSRDVALTLGRYQKGSPKQKWQLTAKSPESDQRAWLVELERIFRAMGIHSEKANVAAEEVVRFIAREWPSIQRALHGSTGASSRDISRDGSSPW